MFKKLSCVILVASFFIVLCPPTAPAGVEPSPFKVYLAQTVQQIIVRLGQMDPTGAGGAGQIITRLEAIADPARNVTNVALAKNVLGVMDRGSPAFRSIRSLSRPVLLNQASISSISYRGFPK